MNDLEEIAVQLRIKDDYILVGHAIPDGDCVGSMLGMFQALQHMGKRVVMVLEDPVPVIYHYLPHWPLIQCPGSLPFEPQTAIFLDCSDQCRVAESVRSLTASVPTVINIDHHPGNSMFGDYNYVDPQAAATAEIIYELIERIPVILSAEIADCLYAGLIMDTGSFLNSNTTSSTMRIAAMLLDSGASVEQARNNLFESKPLQEVMLLAQALNHLTLTSHGRIAWMSLTYDEVLKADALHYHPEGVINYTRMIQGVEIGLLFREVEPGQVKIGFRSRGTVDVASLAREFGGGGHKLAAGASLEGSLEMVKSTILARLEDEFSS